MRRLGAIIAGGKASRFGGDKAAALLNGRALIEHVASELGSQADHLIICGREWPGIDSVADQPASDLGPLGGLNAALHYAQTNGFDVVLTAGCDVLPVPQMPETTANDAALFLEHHYLFGVWPASLAGALQRHLTEQADRSMRHWIAKIGAQPFYSDAQHFNLNTPADLDAYAANLQGNAA